MAFGGETADSYYDEGLTAAMRGEIEQAVAHFQRALELEPGHIAAQHQLGKCHLRLGDLTQAVDYFQRVIRAKPSQLPPRLDLGFALLEQNRADQAERVFLEVLNVKQDNARAQLGLAYCAFEKAEWERALQLAQASTQQGAAQFAAWYLLGRAAKLCGRLEAASEALKRAEALMEKAIETAPDQPESYYLRGEVQFALEHFPEALDSFRAAEDRSRMGEKYSSYGEYFTRLDILGRRGACLQRLGRVDDARAVGRQILEADPGHKLGRALSEG